MPSHLKDLVRAQEAGPHDDTRLERSRSVADTAFSIAVVRAEEGERPEAERLFEDPYAHLFAAAGEHAADCTQRFLDLPGFREAVRTRTRFIDDAVRDGLADGLDQVVLLGAGFDARGLRIREIERWRARAYEVDTGEQLARKRKVLAAGGIAIPANIRYVPFDFDTADYETELTAALEVEGFRRGAGAVFVWEGVIGYIGSDEIARNLRFMASEGGPRSRLVFTYGEGSFDPETAAERTRRAGFRSCQELAGDELWRRYLPGEPYAGAALMKLGIAIV